MAQVTIYLPDDVADEVRRRAREARRPLSAYLVEIIQAHARPPSWPASLVDLLTRGEADLREPDDPPPEEEERLR